MEDWPGVRCVLWRTGREAGSTVDRCCGGLAGSTVGRYCGGLAGRSQGDRVRRLEPVDGGPSPSCELDRRHPPAGPGRAAV